MEALCLGSLCGISATPEGSRIEIMLLSLILETLDAELGRLERLREIVAELGVPSANVVSSAGVAALLAQPRSEPAATEVSQSAPAVPEAEERPVPTPRRRARRATSRASDEISNVPSRQEAEVKPLPEDPLEVSRGADLEDESPLVSELAVSSPKALRSEVAVQVVSRPKPSMVVVSATEAARERASRAARQPVKRTRGEEHVAKPDAKPEDLARDLAARWLSGSGGAAELRGR